MYVHIVGWNGKTNTHVDHYMMHVLPPNSLTNRKKKKKLNNAQQIFAVDLKILITIDSHVGYDARNL